MRKLLKYLKEYKIQAILSPLFKMLEASFELTVPLVVSSMIDRGIGDGKYIIRGFIILIILGIVGLVSSCTAQYFAAKAATGFSKGLRHDLFKHLLNLNFSQIDNIGTSTMITRMTSDVNTVQSGVNMFLRLFLRSPFIVTGAMVMAFTIDFKAALVFVGVIAILGVVVALIMRFNIPMLKKVQKNLDGVLNLTRENISGSRVIRAFTSEDHEYERFTDSNNKLSALQLKAGSVSGLLNPLTYVIINIAIVILIFVGGNQAQKGIITTGQVVALYNYMSQILLELIKFASLIVTINKALASANRISDVFEIPEGMEIADDVEGAVSKGDTTCAERSGVAGTAKDSSFDSASGKGYIEFKDVSLRYHDGADESLSGISLSIEQGSTLGVIGGTGSGKSSLISLIPRFYDVTSGSVSVDGRDVRTWDLQKLRSMAGVVMQKAVLFSGTIKDNLLWGNENATDAELEEAVRIAQAADVVTSKGGMDALIEAAGRNLSGGQRQRLSIARALVRKPSILILDDSSSALDNITDAALRKSIKELDYKPTVIIVSQRTSSVQNADKILVLDDGVMVGLGTHEELLADCEIYREIYESQNRE